MCLYAGSLVPAEIVACAAVRPVVDTAPLHLDQIVALMAEAHAAGQDVARVHSGDPSLYGAIAEQMRRLDELGIPYEVVPGVSSFTAAAAALRLELTPAGANQTVILTRAAGRTGVPENESLAELARHRDRTGAVPRRRPGARGGRGPDAALRPRRAGRGRLPRLVAGPARSCAARWRRCTRRSPRRQIRLTALILVGPMLEPERAHHSRLYDPDYSHHDKKGS